MTQYTIPGASAPRKCRILHVNESAGGGVERYLQSLIAGLDRMRFENILACSSDYDETGFHGMLAGFEPIPQMQHDIGLTDISAVRALRRRIKKYRPDIIYAHSSKAGVYARLANLGQGAHCVYNPHGWAFNMQVSPLKQHAYATAERLLAPLCDKIICVSAYEEASALKWRIARPDQFAVIMNGIDLNRARRQGSGGVMRAQLGIPEDAFVVGTVGRLSPQKAPDTFLSMAERLIESHPGAHFVMVGGGELETEIRSSAAAVRLGGRLHITGWVDNSMDYVRLFDVAVLLSRWEAFGLVLAEYMAAGKPVVATRTQGIPEIIEDGVNGLLVDVDDAAQAAQAVERLRSDAALSRRLIESGTLRVEREFTIERVVAEHEALFDALMKAPARGRARH